MPESGLPQGVVVFLMSDVEGSTVFWDREPEAMSEAMRQHDEIFQRIVPEFAGVLLKERGEGDSQMAVFQTASEALGAAISIQQRLKGDSWPTSRPIRVRMALHAGECIERADDYYGGAVNRCARLRAIAAGGQVLASEVFTLMASDSLPNGAAFLDLGRHRLRDLTRPEQVFQVVHPDLPRSFPELASASILPNNLPVTLSSFVGREREISEVESMLGKSRLVALVGAGGCGKTRLALQVAADTMHLYADGCWFVELASTLEPNLVPALVARATGANLSDGAEPVDAIVERFADGRALLVFDNCEHILDATANLAATLLGRILGLSILATSREGLGLDGEQQFHVPSLSVPAPDITYQADELAEFEAVELFVQRATARDQRFVLNASNANAVAAICRRLDGIPLAIELAASKTALFSPDQILARLDHSFDLLVGTGRTQLARHQTLHAAIAWSFGLLSEVQRDMIHWLSVFPAGCTLEAAEAVCIPPEGIRGSVADLLEQLVSKSLVVAEDGADGLHRFRMLETIRQFAIEDRGSEFPKWLYEAFFAWYLKLALEADGNLRGPNSDNHLAMLDSESGNLRAAILWGLENERFEDALAFANGVRVYWLRRGLYAEGRQIYQRALPRATGANPQKATATNALAVFAWRQGDLDDAQFRFQEALELFQRLDDSLGEARSLSNLGLIHSSLSRFEEARTAFAKSAEIFDRHDNKWELALALGNLGLVESDLGNYGAALGPIRRAERIQRSLNAKWLLGTTLSNLSALLMRMNEFSKAFPNIREALQIAAEETDPVLAELAVRRFGIYAAKVGQPSVASRLLGSAEAIRKAHGIPLDAKEQAENDAAIETARNLSGSGAAKRAEAVGRTAAWQDIVAWALSKANSAPFNLVEPS